MESKDKVEGTSSTEQGGVLCFSEVGQPGPFISARLLYVTRGSPCDRDKAITGRTKAEVQSVKDSRMTTARRRPHWNCMFRFRKARHFLASQHSVIFVRWRHSRDVECLERLGCECVPQDTLESPPVLGVSDEANLCVGPLTRQPLPSETASLSITARP